MEKNWVAWFLPRENWEANIDIDLHWQVGGEGKGYCGSKQPAKSIFRPDSFDLVVLRGSLPSDGNLFCTDGTGLGYEPQRPLLAKGFSSFLMNGSAITKIKLGN